MFTVFRSIRRPYITIKLPRGDMDRPPRPSPRTRPITGHRNMHLHHLWNGMFDRHRAEITIMQFTDHSLPVHHFLMAPWDFYLVPYCQPSCILQVENMEIRGKVEIIEVILYSHDQLYIHIYMQKHNDTIKTSDTVL